jgi:D-alanine transfer protein
MQLSYATKQAAARRMLDFPRTLAADPVLKFALGQLANDSAVSGALYYAVLPLGKLQNWLLRLQDHWETLDFIRQRPDLAVVAARAPEQIDWESLLAAAERDYRRHADDNPFGFDNEWYRRELRGRRLGQRNGLADEELRSSLQHSAGWADLDALLRVLRDLGARPLILSAPIQGTYLEYQGVSAETRAAYYDKFRKIVESNGVAVRDFAEHDGDKYFLRDPEAHLSEKGWAYYDQVLDAFYHGALD